MIDAQEMVRRLSGAEPGATVFVSYRAGRPPTERAVAEAEKADHEGYPKRWYLGQVVRQWVTKKGDPVFTLFTTTRYNEDNVRADGHYRTINPNLGQLMVLEVIS